MSHTNKRIELIMGWVKIITFCVGGFILGGVVFFVTGWFTAPYSETISNEDESKLAIIKRLTKNKWNAFDIQEDLNKVSPDSMRNFLLELSKEPHLAGSDRDEYLAGWIKSQWEAFGLDVVDQVKYQMLLSYPDPAKPNMITLQDDEHGLLFENSVIEDGVEGDDTNFVDAFLAYAKAGQISGDVVYTNYGRIEDYEMLMDPNSEYFTNVTGKICLTRYGKGFRGNKVQNGADNDCIAVIIFSDPADVAAEGTEDVYPDSFWLPESGIQRGSSFLGHGDPETPGWPSLDNVYRVPDDVLAKRLPPIPAQPIGYKDAAVILGAMSGELVPPDWMGGIAGVEYRLGGSFDPEKCATNCRLSIEVNNKLERKVSSNVVGILRGSEEPDRYVLLGNHRDAWGYGAVDPSSGTAQMMEVVRILGQKANTTEWRPRRSMVFLSWGAEEYGLMGSTEFTEHYLTKLKERAIVYINCDICVAGSVLKSFSTPTVNHKLLQATKVVPSPFNPEQSYYEFWHNWTSQGDSGNSEPVTNLPAAGSDHAFFIYELGIPVIDFSVKPDFHEYPNLEFYNYPTYHTGFETFALVDEILDPGFKQHQVCAGLNLVMGRSLADDLLLDFDPKQYYQLMKTSVDDFTTSGVEDKLLSLNLTLKHVRSAVQEFNDTAALWNTRRSSKAIVEDPLALRILNDQVMKLDRTFLLPEGLPRRTEFRHAIISPSEHDSYGAGSFPGISDLLFHFDSLTSQEQGDRTKQLDRHLSDLMILIKNAANFLKNPEMIV
eukprot:TCALIF_04806-PA protein Name:"Similar to Naalad2 N-acetylated-alpha-linked acidic dipeptidase 2 (Mus musculus)" AED:0.00 eAED:0.00 QI:0/-1/0/1/-1/1/1/0/771